MANAVILDFLVHLINTSTSNMAISIDILSPEVLKKATEVEIFDENGVKIKFGSLYADQKAMIIFIRHFFCGNCMVFIFSRRSNRRNMFELFLHKSSQKNLLRRELVFISLVAASTHSSRIMPTKPRPSSLFTQSQHKSSIKYWIWQETLLLAKSRITCHSVYGVELSGVCREDLQPARRCSKVETRSKMGASKSIFRGCD